MEAATWVACQWPERGLTGGSPLPPRHCTNLAGSVHERPLRPLLIEHLWLAWLGRVHGHSGWWPALLRRAWHQAVAFEGHPRCGPPNTEASRLSGSRLARPSFCTPPPNHTVMPRDDFQGVPRLTGQRCGRGPIQRLAPGVSSSLSRVVCGWAWVVGGRPHGWPASGPIPNGASQKDLPTPWYQPSWVDT